MTVLCSEGQYDNARAQLPGLCHQRQRRTPRHRLGLQHMGRRSGRPVSPRGRTTTAWHASSATCLAMTFTTSVILSARAARSTPTARTTRSMRFPSRDWTLCWLSGRTGIQSGMADGRTGAQGRTRARNNALWAVLAVLMMESINEEKTLLLIPQY